MSDEAFDPLLHPYLQATTEEEAQREAARLIATEATPIVSAIIARKLGLARRADGIPPQDAEDVQNDAVVKLLGRLRKCREGDTQDGTGPAVIADFRGYVAVTSFHCCYEYLRRRHPHWYRLKNRVRYALEKYEAFGLWQDERQEWLGGLAAWGGPLRRRDSEKLQQLRGSPNGPETTQGRGDAFVNLSLAEQLEAVFHWLGHPVEVDELVSLLARWTLVDTARKSAPSPDVVATWFDVDAQLDRRSYLDRLWEEIVQLPPRQRTALLLGLRDGQQRSGLRLFTALGVARLRTIAPALGLTAEELAELWNRLPLSDLEIGARLGATQRQVINLRKAARERLARHMSKE